MSRVARFSKARVPFVLSMLCASGCGIVGSPEVASEDCSWSQGELAIAEQTLDDWEQVMTDASSDATTRHDGGLFEIVLARRVAFSDDDSFIPANCLMHTVVGKPLNLRLVVFDDVASASKYHSSYTFVAQDRLDSRRYDVGSPDDVAVSDEAGELTVYGGLARDLVGGEAPRELQFYDVVLWPNDCPLIMIDGRYIDDMGRGDASAFELLDTTARAIEDFVRQAGEDTYCQPSAES